MRYKMKYILFKVEESHEDVFKIYKTIYIKDAMFFPALAWDDIASNCIENCFKCIFTEEFREESALPSPQNETFLMIL